MRLKFVMDFSFLIVATGSHLEKELRHKKLCLFPTIYDTNRAVQPQKIVRGLKFRIQEVKGLNNLCIEHRGADQLRGHCTADLHLCLRICKKKVFHDAAQIMNLSW